MFLNDKEITLSTDIQDFCSMSRLEDFDYAFQEQASLSSRNTAAASSPARARYPSFTSPFPGCPTVMSSAHL